MGDFRSDTNAASLGRAIADLASDLGDLEAPNAQAGRVLEARLREPRRSGVLAASRRVVASAMGFELRYGAPYWTFVHWGAPKRHLKAQPWALAAYRLTRDELVDVLLDHTQTAVAKVKGS